METGDKDITKRFNKWFNNLKPRTRLIITGVVLFAVFRTFQLMLASGHEDPPAAVVTHQAAPLDNGYSDADRAAAMGRIQQHMNDPSEKRFRCQHFHIQCD